MITYVKKDITTVESPAILLNGVNCQNAMGSGVALAYFRKWSNVKEMYHKLGIHNMKLGVVQPLEVDTDLYVFNCFTQEKYGRDGKRYADAPAIFKCLSTTVEIANELGITDIYMPRIGCGLGGLSWKQDVLPMIELVDTAHRHINITVCDY